MICDNDGICACCEYGPVPLQTVPAMIEGRVCSVCAHTKLIHMKKLGQDLLAQSLGVIANALIDGHGYGYRVAVENRLGGDTDPGGTYEVS